MADLIIPKDDYGYNLAFTVVDSDGDAYNLSGYTITLKVWKPGTPGTLVVEGSCDITVAASGTCTYTIADGDFDTDAQYKMELELTKTGKVESTKNYDILVESSG